jgi:hypothetical protein
MNRRFAIAFFVLAGTALPARAGGPVGLGFDLRLGGYIQASGWATGCCSPGCGPCGYGGGGAPGCAPCFGFGPCFAPAYCSWGLPAPVGLDRGGYPGYPGPAYGYPQAGGYCPQTANGAPAHGYGQ